MRPDLRAGLLGGVIATGAGPARLPLQRPARSGGRAHRDGRCHLRRAGPDRGVLAAGNVRPDHRCATRSVVAVPPAGVRAERLRPRSFGRTARIRHRPVVLGTTCNLNGAKYEARKIGKRPRFDERKPRQNFGAVPCPFSFRTASAFSCSTHSADLRLLATMPP